MPRRGSLPPALAYALRKLGLEASEDSVLRLLREVGVEVPEGELPRLVEEVRSCRPALPGEIPRLMERGRRKRLAAYYTGGLGVRLMAELARAHAEAGGPDRLVLADPFAGAGLTLAEAVDLLGPRVGAVWAVEADPAAAVAAYASLASRLGPGSVRVVCGDAFRVVPELASEGVRADAVLTNPPFTRWEALEPEYRREVLSHLDPGLTVRRQVGLQVPSLFLIDLSLIHI